MLAKCLRLMGTQYSSLFDGVSSSSKELAHLNLLPRSSHILRAARILEGLSCPGEQAGKAQKLSLCKNWHKIMEF